MQIVIQIIIAVLVFGVIIFVHELGHFLAAKAMSIRVLEFAMGMGPKLYSVVKGETRYSLRMLPIGGYVQMEGEDEESLDGSAFCQKKVWQRVIVIVAGAAMNILLGFIIILGLTIAQQSLLSTTLAQFNEDATSNSQLQVNDRILKINNRTVRIGNDIIFELVRDTDGAADIVVERQGQKVDLTGVPFAMRQAEDGTQYISLDFKVYALERTPSNILSYAGHWTMGTVKQVWVSFLELVSGKYKLNQLSGPVGVTSAIGEAASMGLDSVLLLVALITVNIGVFNLLPLPALDGGRLVFLAIEGIFRRPVPQKYEAYIHAAGLIALFGLMIVVTVSDILKLL